MDANRDRNRDRIRSAIGVVLCHLLLGYALITGLAPGTAARAGEALKLFDVPAGPPPPPHEDPAPARAAPDREGAAAPPNLEARPAPVVVPPPKLPAPQPVAAAPAAGPGADASAGASDKAGPGSGSGGRGAGTGSGQAGGGPGGGGPAARAERIAGRILDSDYPRSASAARIGGTVIVRFTVGVDGRPRECIVARSSGHADLDAATCRLIERRFRYRPARDAEGKAVPEAMGWKQSWWQEPR